MYIIIFNCKVILYLLSNRFHVAVRLFSNRSQMTSKCGKNKKVAHEAIAKCVTDVCECHWPLRLPTAATAKLTFPRQDLLSHGKTYFLMAKLTLPRENLRFHGKTFFLSHGKTYLSTRQNFLSFSRQNLLFHGKTFFSKGLPKIGNPKTKSGIRMKVVKRLKLPRKAINSTMETFA